MHKYLKTSFTSDFLKFVQISFIVLLALSINASAQVCDTVSDLRRCWQEAATFTVSSGRDAHYIDVPFSPNEMNLQNAMTVEMYVNIIPQPGNVQFLGGYWGPHPDAQSDNNDSWVLFIDQNNRLTFTVNGPVPNGGSGDDSRVQVPFGDFYNTWTHVAAVFDGADQTVSLYIDGYLFGSSSNASNPANSLYPVRDEPELRTMFGSINGITDDPDVFRNMRGQMDEIRVWSKAVTESEMICLYREYVDTDASEGLQLHFRCNGAENDFDLCDASDNGMYGELRGGGRLTDSDFSFPQSMFIDSVFNGDAGSSYRTNVRETVYCDRVWFDTLVVWDTAACPFQPLMLRWSNWNVNQFPENRGDHNFFSLWYPDGTGPIGGNTRIPLVQDQPDTIIVRMETDKVGLIKSRVYFREPPEYGRCGRQPYVDYEITRLGGLDYSETSIVFDTLYAGCQEQQFVERTIEVTNITDRGTAPQVIRIDDILNSLPPGFTSWSTSKPLPATVAVGETMEITVRFANRDTNQVFSDTLKIVSTDCVDTTYIPISATIADVFVINRPAGGEIEGQHNFGRICVGQLSEALQWTWQNMIERPISMDTVILPEGITGRRLVLPTTLEPATGYPQSYFRFKPERSGVFDDTIVFRASFTTADGHTCTVEKYIPFRAIGLDTDAEFTIDSLDVGLVKVGQTGSVNVTVRNTGIDAIAMSFYFERAEVFEVTPTSFTLNPGATRDITVTFRPLTDSVYLDQLCLFEQRCFTVACIPVRGEGYIDEFEFTPEVLTLENVLGCGSQRASVWIHNRTGVQQSLTNFVLLSPGAKWTLVNPANFPSTQFIPAQDSVEYEFQYTPADVTVDRADDAFVQYRADGQLWEVPLAGTSVVPRLFVSENTLFGDVEVGDILTRTAQVENVSTIDVVVDDIQVPAGFAIVNYGPGDFPRTLAPRDTMRLEIEFAPAAAQVYQGTIDVSSSDPCPNIQADGVIRGRGVIMEMEVGLKTAPFGFTRSCDCSVKDVLINNTSFAFPLDIDSIVIEDVGLPNGGAQYFSYSSFYGGTSASWQVPESQFDTLFVSYCPRAANVPDSAAAYARLHIYAHGPGWSTPAEGIVVDLSGKQSLSFTPTPSMHTFAPVAVDLAGVVIDSANIDYEIPGVFYNPWQDTIVIDSVGFIPDERVFSVAATFANALPIVLAPGQRLSIQTFFRPRAPREYRAKLAVYSSQPCVDVDSTVLLIGRGYGFVTGMGVYFDPSTSATPTLRFNSCDTIRASVWTDKRIDASVIDMEAKMLYDTSLLQLVGFESQALSMICESDDGLPWQPSFSILSEEVDGARFLLKNFCQDNRDVEEPIVTALFLAKNPTTTTTTLRIDEFDFDTEDILTDEILAVGGSALLEIYEVSSIIAEAQSTDASISFADTRVLDCTTQSYTVVNTGDVSVTIEELLDIPTDVTIASITPPQGTSLAPGASAEVLLRYCPQDIYRFASTTAAVMLSDSVFDGSQCSVVDFVGVTGASYAPETLFMFNVVNEFASMATVSQQLGDTLTLGLYANRDFGAEYSGVQYWLEDISFAVDLNWNPTMLYLLELESVFGEAVRIENADRGRVSLSFENIDRVEANTTLATMRMLVTVPDTNIAPMFISADPNSFVVPGLMFLDITTATVTTMIMTIDKCNISYLPRANGGGTEINSITPNPAASIVTTEFHLGERVPVDLEVFDANGRLVETLIGGPGVYQIGTYKASFDVKRYQSGMYFIRIVAGAYHDTQSFRVVK